jgi:hypothetical protein
LRLFIKALDHLSRTLLEAGKIVTYTLNLITLMWRRVSGKYLIYER